MQHHRIAQVSCLARNYANINITFGVAVASLALKLLLPPIRLRGSFESISLHARWFTLGNVLLFFGILPLNIM